MTKIERVVAELSDMYDIWLTFRRARIADGLHVESPIPGMTNEEFDDLRRKSPDPSTSSSPPTTSSSPGHSPDS